MWRTHSCVPRRQSCRRQGPTDCPILQQVSRRVSTRHARVRAPRHLAACEKSALEATHAASVPSRAGFDNGSVNEIRWYGTRGISEPRAPRLSLTKPYRSMVFSVRERFDFFRPVSSARRASDSGADSAMIPSRARLRSDKTLAKLSADLNHTFGSSAAGLYFPLAISNVRA